MPGDRITDAQHVENTRRRSPKTARESTSSAARSNSGFSHHRTTIAAT